MPTKGGNRRTAKRTIATKQSATTTPSPTVVSKLTDKERFEDWKQNKPHDYWLVQRIQLGRGWFGNRFELDYMGAAEFEFGAPHKALARMREAGNFMLHEEPIAWKGQTRSVYFLAPAGEKNRDHLECKIADFSKWLENGARSKMGVDFPQVFTDDYGFLRPEDIYTVAWWSLDDDILWTLDPIVAGQLLCGIKSPASS